MFNLKVGQELEFIEAAHADDRLIPKGTRVRVGFMMDEMLEAKVTLVVLGGETPETLTVPRRVVTMHCQPVRTIH